MIAPFEIILEHPVELDGVTYDTQGVRLQRPRELPHQFARANHSIDGAVLQRSAMAFGRAIGNLVCIGGRQGPFSIAGRRPRT
jgi:hypothetical protein